MEVDTTKQPKARATIPVLHTLRGLVFTCTRPHEISTLALSRPEQNCRARYKGNLCSSESGRSAESSRTDGGGRANTQCTKGCCNYMERTVLIINKLLLQQTAFVSLGMAKHFFCDKKIFLYHFGQTTNSIILIVNVTS